MPALPQRYKVRAAGTYRKGYRGAHRDPEESAPGFPADGRTEQTQRKTGIHHSLLFKILSLLTTGVVYCRPAPWLDLIAAAIHQDGQAALLHSFILSQQVGIIRPHKQQTDMP